MKQVAIFKIKPLEIKAKKRKKGFSRGSGFFNDEWEEGEESNILFKK